MKKNAITLSLSSLLLGSVILITGCSEPVPEKDVFNDTKKEVVQEDSKVISAKDTSQSVTQQKNVNTQQNVAEKPAASQNLSENFKDYSSIQTKVKDPELQKMIDDTIKEYESILATIDNDRSVQEKEITEPRMQNINELKAELLKEEDNKQKECQVITTANEEACNIMEKNITGLKNVILGIETDIKNSLGQLDVVTLNNKRKLNSQMRSNVSQLVSQEKS